MRVEKHQCNSLVALPSKQCAEKASLKTPEGSTGKVMQSILRTSTIFMIVVDVSRHYLSNFTRLLVVPAGQWTRVDNDLCAG